MAEKLGIARQTISKWENGQAVPEISGLIRLSNLYGITVDRIVKDDAECNLALDQSKGVDTADITEFLVRAKHNTYAGKGHEVESSRLQSHDYSYEEEPYQYYDTYLGGEKFAGEEAVWHGGSPVWSMNYVGRVVGNHFDSDFLREALNHVPEKYPFRGPEIYIKGDYHYHCKVDGDFSWYQGYEEIFYGNEKVYECYFHGGILQ